MVIIVVTEDVAVEITVEVDVWVVMVDVVEDHRPMLDYHPLLARVMVYNLILIMTNLFALIVADVTILRKICGTYMISQELYLQHQ